jgi:hypothetical protein
VTHGHGPSREGAAPCRRTGGARLRGAGVGALLVLALGAPGRAAGDDTYVVDAARGTVSVHVGRSGLFGFAGHEHVVIAPRLEGEILADPARLESSSVSLTFESAALQVSPRGEPPSDVPKVRARMLGPDVLDAIRFPSGHGDAHAPRDRTAGRPARAGRALERYAARPRPPRREPDRLRHEARVRGRPREGQRRGLDRLHDRGHEGADEPDGRGAWPESPLLIPRSLTIRAPAAYCARRAAPEAAPVIHRGEP